MAIYHRPADAEPRALSRDAAHRRVAVEQPAGMVRTDHVFDDGPGDQRGLRSRINSAGYGVYLSQLKEV